MRTKSVVCIGAALIDESYRCENQPLAGTSNPASLHRSAGGVARNIAHHLALLGNPVQLISHFGNDPEGQWLMDQCATSRIGLSHALVNNIPTGRFVALLSPEGNLFAGAVSTHFETLITPAFLQTRIPVLKEASLLQIDCNLSAESLNWLLQFSRNEEIPCIIEPVSVPKAERLKKTDLNGVLLITPNHDEMAAFQGETGEELVQTILDLGVRYLWLRKGKEGSILYSEQNPFELSAPEVQIIDTTGAGDAALAGWIHAWLHDQKPEDCVRYGHAMASLVLQINGAIRKDLDLQLLEETFNHIFKK
jgi:pseudouridine kinase